MDRHTVIATARHDASKGPASMVIHLLCRYRRLMYFAALSSLLLAFDVTISHAALNPFGFLFKSLKRHHSSTSNAEQPFDSDDLKQRMLNQALRQRPDDADLHYQLGQVYEEFGQWAQAVKEYRQAARLNPEWADAHYRLGVAYEQLGTYDFQGETWIDNKKLKRAIVEYRETVRIDPTRLDAHYRLSLAYQTTGRLDLASAHCRAMLQADPDYYLARQLVQALYTSYLEQRPG